MSVMKFDKLVSGKNLSETEQEVLHYMVANIDRVLDMGVRGVAKANSGRLADARSVESCSYPLHAPYISA